jgi:hypothetical protein
VIIEEKEDVWHVIFFPAAENHELEDKMNDRGYRAMVGRYNDAFVPKYIDYSKSKFSLDQAIKYAKNISQCSICTNLNSKVSEIEHIYALTPNNHIEHKYDMQPQKSDNNNGHKEPPTTEMFKNMLMQVFFNSFFTRPGLFFIGSMLDDDSLISQALPTNISDKEMQDFVYELALFFSGAVPLIRSPEEMRSFAETLRRREEVKEVKKEKEINIKDLMKYMDTNADALNALF